MRKSAFVTVALTICVMTSSCLKTRAELRQETKDGPGSENAPQAAQIKDVQPQGQYVIDELKGEITRLNGRIEDLERAQRESAGQNKEAEKEQVKKLEARVIELESAQAQMLEAIKKMQEAPAASADPIDAFENGKKHFRSDNFDGAVEQLSIYLKNPKGRFSEEATYLRGESYFHLKQYKKAIVDFSKFPEKYNRSKIMPTALLRIGQSFEALGMKEDAAGFYQELVDKFPKSSEAKKARPKLR